MAKITGPLLSLGARGTVAGTATFSAWKGRPYVRQRVIPANPNTAAQQATRSVFRQASDIWKNAGPLFIAPWNRFADGQVVTGRNKMIGDYTRELRGKPDLADMIWSPGAKGGTPPSSLSLTPGVGEIACLVTTPPPPTGWTLAAAVFAILRDGDPAALPSVVMEEAEDTVTFNSHTFTGLTAAVPYRVGAWLRWTRPDTSAAYGTSLSDTATPT